MMQRMRGTIVPRVAIHPGSVIDTRLSSTASGMFGVTDAGWSGLNDRTPIFRRAGAACGGSRP
jgi:hypothetical protein